MIEYFNVTSIGHSHIKAGKICQDHSMSCSDGERTIITACDGHGGESYIRSHRGSLFASHAMLRSMLDTESLTFRRYSAEEIEHNLKLNILCEWNRLVREDLAEHPLRKSEASHLTKEEIDALRKNPVRAYGTTLTGAMLFGRRLICVQLGDGGCFLLRDGEICPAFKEDSDEPVANVTYSLCDERAFDHMHASIFNMSALDGVLLCTDGVLAPYQSTKNFKNSVVRPVVRRVLEGKTNDVKSFIEELGARSGVGDDVSLSMILKDNVKAKFYQ